MSMSFRKSCSICIYVAIDKRKTTNNKYLPSMSCYVFRYYILYHLRCSRWRLLRNLGQILCSMENWKRLHRCNCVFDEYVVGLKSRFYLVDHFYENKREIKKNNVLQFECLLHLCLFLKYQLKYYIWYDNNVGVFCIKPLLSQINSTMLPQVSV